MTEAGAGARRASTALVAAAFGAIYLFWGSTYLGIVYATETLPPFGMAAVRFLAAGAALYTILRWRGAAAPTRRHWLHASVVGTLLLVCGNGAVVWAEQGGRVPTGTAALLVATVPLWMVVLNWAWWDRIRPSAQVLAGIGIGLAGLVLLVGPGALAGARVDALGAGVLLAGSLCWAGGSLYARGAPRPSSALMTAAMQMLAAGLVFIGVSAVAGEPSAFHPGAVSASSVLALLYLIVFGSLVGYTAYSYLLGVSSPARVSTYAYVNPVVAMFLGWALNAEPLTPRLVVASAVILSAVALITMARRGVGRPGYATRGNKNKTCNPNADGSEPAAGWERPGRAVAN